MELFAQAFSETCLISPVLSLFIHVKLCGCQLFEMFLRLCRITYLVRLVLDVKHVGLGSLVPSRRRLFHRVVVSLPEASCVSMTYDITIVL